GEVTCPPGTSPDVIAAVHVAAELLVRLARQKKEENEPLKQAQLKQIQQLKQQVEAAQAQSQSLLGVQALHESVGKISTTLSPLCTSLQKVEPQIPEDAVTIEKLDAAIQGSTLSAKEKQKLQLIRAGMSKGQALSEAEFFAVAAKNKIALTSLRREGELTKRIEARLDRLKARQNERSLEKPPVADIRVNLKTH